MGKKKIKKPKKRIIKKYSDINIDQILLQHRHIFIFGEIDEKMSYHITQKLLALSEINSKPILLYINSPGGTVADGFAIIDCMQNNRSPIITMILGRACSMAGLVSIAGDRRLIVPHGMWMSHNLTAGVYGNVKTIEDRTEHYKNLQQTLNYFLKRHTKLTDNEIKKAVEGELWLDPEDCIKKGIVDEICGKTK